MTYGKSRSKSHYLHSHHEKISIPLLSAARGGDGGLCSGPTHDAVKLINAPQEPTGKDRVIVPEAGSVIWARFYDLETNKPIYVGREGVKKATLAEIENERRARYAYAGVWPANLLNKEYPRWQKKWAATPVTGTKL